MEIIFQGNNTNFYYTISEYNTKIENGIISGNATITGHSKEKITIGDVLNINMIKYEVINIKFRDCKGVFNNPEDAFNSHFTADCSFKRLQKT